MNPGISWDLAGRGLNQIMIFSRSTPDKVRLTAPSMPRFLILLPTDGREHTRHIIGFTRQLLISAFSWKKSSGNPVKYEITFL